MTDIIAWLAARPWASATMSCCCLLDAANCVCLAHTDWWFPATLAFAMALLVRREERP